MRTTLYINDDLLKQVKLIAVKEGQTFTDFTENALREAIARRKSTSPTPKLNLKTFKGSGLNPSVDIDSNSQLLDLMDEK